MKNASPIATAFLAAFLVTACDRAPTAQEKPPAAAPRLAVDSGTETGLAWTYLHGLEQWTGMHVVDLGALTGTRVFVTGLVTANPNEQSLVLLSSETCAAPWTTEHVFPVGDPTPTSPAVVSAAGFDTYARCVALDAGDGFEGEVFLMAQEN